MFTGTAPLRNLLFCLYPEHLINIFTGNVVRQVRAVDADGDDVTYEIVSHSGDSASIFFMTPSNGEIRTLKSLSTAAQRSYTVSISLKS